jgi:ADP-ribose pyrophosphatase YjhB (NUDIX family)
MINSVPKYCPNCGNNLIVRIHSGRRRPACPLCDWVFFPDPKVAVAVLIKKNDQVLLVQRKYDPKKGHWSLPSGFVDAGEDPKQTAIRETREETGLEITEIRLLDVVFSQEHPRGASIIIVYLADVENGVLNAGDDAVQAAYFKLNSLPPLAFTSAKQILLSFL